MYAKFAFVTKRQILTIAAIVTLGDMINVRLSLFLDIIFLNEFFITKIYVF